MSLIEKIAELEHAQWVHWTTYFLKNLTLENEQRWRLQCMRYYKDLPEEQKESDRVWAKKVLSIIDQHYLDERKSGLVAVKECPCGLKWGIVVPDGCQCNRTGRIVRELSCREALEWAKWKANPCGATFPKWMTVDMSIEVKEG